MTTNIHPLILFLISLIPASCCAYGARKRGYNPTFWFAIGMIFGFLGFIALYLFTKKRKLHQIPSPKSIPYRFPKPSDDHKLWHYLDKAHNMHGPMSIYALYEVWQKKEITPSTHVWNEDMKEWKPISELPKLTAQLHNF